MVAVGASAGGVEALRSLVQGLPDDFSATLLVVLHLPTTAYSALPLILDRAGHLPAMTAEDGMPLKAGTVMVAPPDRHLIVRDGHVALGRGPKENGHRPAIDPLFRSVARWYGSQAVGVILSGTLDDGAAGLVTIRERGGVAVVQAPDLALYSGMPAAALRAVPDAMTASGRELADLLVTLTREEVDAATVPTDWTLELETDIPHLDESALAVRDRPGRHPLPLPSGPRVVAAVAAAAPARECRGGRLGGHPQPAGEGGAAPQSRRMRETEPSLAALPRGTGAGGRRFRGGAP